MNFFCIFILWDIFVGILMRNFLEYFLGYFSDILQDNFWNIFSISNGFNQIYIETNSPGRFVSGLGLGLYCLLILVWIQLL